ncbi:hypothetical protein SAMN04487843_12332 [Methylobacterium sp. ap11]|nr:hypothetical protein SAMN04487843_12332 [Methylobacterium sp. ap11]
MDMINSVDRARKDDDSATELSGFVVVPSHPRPHPEVSVHRRGTDLEGGLQMPPRSLDPSFEAHDVGTSG